MEKSSLHNRMNSSGLLGELLRTLSPSSNGQCIVLGSAFSIQFSCLLDIWIAKILILTEYPKNIFRFIQPVHVNLKTDNVDYLKKPP